jgi:hypothetical protein
VRANQVVDGGGVNIRFKHRRIGELPIKYSQQVNYYLGRRNVCSRLDCHRGFARKPDNHTVGLYADDGAVAIQAGSRGFKERIEAEFIAHQY